MSESFHMKSSRGCNCVTFYFDDYFHVLVQHNELLKQNWGVISLTAIESEVTEPTEISKYKDFH
jgi:hypothetical protein